MDLLSTSSEYDASDTASSIATRMGDMVQDMGLEHFSFLFLSGPCTAPGIATTTLHTSYPAEWVHRYTRHKYWNVDPVTDLGRRSIRPFFWGQGPFLDRFAKSQRLVFEEAGVFDIKFGMTIPMRGLKGELSVFTVVSSMKSRLEDAVKDGYHRISAAAYDTHDVALREMTNRELDTEQRAELSPREKECLSWTLEGKTAGEISTILGISVSTVNQHAASASHKLGSLNKHHAAVQALRLNLIH